MTQPTVEEVETTLDRVADADDEEAASLLRAAREDVGQLRQQSGVDEAEVDRLEKQLERHESAVDHRDEYDGALGAAMNPDDEDAA